MYHTWFVNTARQASAAAHKQAQRAEPRYTSEQLAEIDAKYELEVRRGALPRHWERTVVGDQLPTLTKGPLTVADIISFHIGWGWSGQGTFALRLAQQHRRHRPDLWTKNRYGAWDTVQRGHWEDDMAHAVGAGRPYDYGFMRSCWLTHAITDWMGDHGWLYRLTDRISRFNHVGDTTTIGGVVAEKAHGPAGPSVIVDLTATNQDDEVNATGRAEVLLPTADDVDIRLPPVPDEAIEFVHRAEGPSGS